MRTKTLLLVFWFGSECGHSEYFQKCPETITKNTGENERGLDVWGRDNSIQALKINKTEGEGKGYSNWQCMNLIGSLRCCALFKHAVYT